MGRPRQVSDEQILAVMRERVLAHGPSVSLDLVAEELDVSTPALLKRFGNRQALMLAALRPPENPDWIQSLLEGPGEGSLEAQLTEIFSRIQAFVVEVAPCISALRESGIPLSAFFTKKQTPELGIRALQTWLDKARKQGLVTARETETESAAFAILGALHHRAFHAHLMKRPFKAQAQREYATDLARLFARSLAP
jgi:AcrR family transcriptional regulator